MNNAFTFQVSLTRVLYGHVIVVIFISLKVLLINLEFYSSLLYKQLSFLTFCYISLELINGRCTIKIFMKIINYNTMA